VVVVLRVGIIAIFAVEIASSRVSDQPCRAAVVCRKEWPDVCRSTADQRHQCSRQVVWARKKATGFYSCPNAIRSATNNKGINSGFIGVADTASGCNYAVKIVLREWINSAAT
jgi:hypothetical protein